MPDRPLILLVDDEEDIRELYSTKLRSEGLNVVTAVNGKECLEIAKRDHPDLILLDLKMPEMDGAEALTHLKEDPETRDIKVVFLTAMSDPRGPAIDSKYAIEVGATDYIKKGGGLREFAEQIRGYL